MNGGSNSYIYLLLVKKIELRNSFNNSVIIH